jgi:hypothetical protein
MRFKLRIVLLFTIEEVTNYATPLEFSPSIGVALNLVYVINSFRILEMELISPKHCFFTARHSHLVL